MSKKIMAVITILIMVLVSGALYVVEARESRSVTEHAGKAVTVSEEAIEATERPIREDANDDVAPEAISSILLIVEDNKDLAHLDQRGNADSILLISINKNTQQLVMSSFLRDTLVEYPQGESTILKLLYHDHGVDALVTSLEQSYSIPIDNYVLLNFLDIIELVDALGGLDVDLKAEEIPYMMDKLSSVNEMLGLAPGSNRIHPEQAGRIHLNGIQTVAYLRTSTQGSEYDKGRTEHSRAAVRTLLGSIKKLDAKELLSLADTFYPKIKTGLSGMEKMKLLMDFASISSYEMISCQIPLEGTFTIQDGKSLLTDFTSNHDYLYKLIYQGEH